MRTEDPAALPLNGDRGATIVRSSRSMHSRIGNFLAFTLMLALGAGALTWYYAGAMHRPARERLNAQADTMRRAQGDSSLPALGPIDPPSTYLREVAPDEPAVRPLMQSVDPEPHGSISSADHPTLASEAPKSASDLDRERRLAGAAFTMPSGSPPSAPSPMTLASAMSASSLPRAPSGPETEGLSSLLHPTPTPAEAAQVVPTMRMLLPKGAFIDCTLETAIDSSLPGMTTCVTATDTFGVDGKVVLLERGTKLVGEIRGQVQQGAARLFVLWIEARTPAGVVVQLASPGTDELGRGGLAGTVDRHFWQRFGAAVLVSVIDGGVQAALQSANRGGGAVIYDPSGTQGVMTEILKGTINLSPTVTKKQGDRIQVLVARDLDFRSVYDLRTETAGRE